MNPEITVDYSTLKNAVREGLSDEGRQFWYPLLPNVGSCIVLRVLYVIC
jgi:hypothetical protein